MSGISTLKKNRSNNWHLIFHSCIIPPSKESMTVSSLWQNCTRGKTSENHIKQPLHILQFTVSTFCGFLCFELKRIHSAANWYVEINSDWTHGSIQRTPVGGGAFIRSLVAQKEKNAWLLGLRKTELSMLRGQSMGRPYKECPIVFLKRLRLRFRLGLAL